MNTEAFKSAYNASRNGLNSRIRHPLARTFVYSDGVEECADAGCHWLLDIIGTEVVPAYKNLCTGNMGIIFVRVANDAATIKLEMEDDMPAAWSRNIEYTDMPPGEWAFYLSNEGDHCLLILPTEY